MNNWRVRPACLQDLAQVHALACASPVGVTSLPDDATRLRRRLELSVASFTSEVAYPGEEDYFFVLEDLDSGKLIGCAGVQATCGYRRPFYSFRHDTFVHASSPLGISNKIHALSLCHDLSAFSVLNSFHVHADWLQGPAAQLLSRSRLLFVAAHAQRFSDRLIAEIVGYSDEQLRSPFWDGLGQHFYGINYAEAQRLDAGSDRAFLAELLPHYPIYVPLLPDATQEVIGQVHPQAQRPYDILVKEGFDNERYVDVYDAGPTLKAATRHIRSIRESCHTSLAIGALQQRGSQQWLVSNDQLADYAATLVEIEWQPGQPIPLTASQADALGVAAGATVRVVQVHKEPT